LPEDLTITEDLTVEDLTVEIPNFNALSIAATTETQLSSWNWTLRHFFCLDGQVPPDPDDSTSLDATVQVLRQMRLVKPKKYHSTEFTNAFKVYHQFLSPLSFTRLT
jgi:hypothetical protein